jgi:hypothetical protein
MFQSASYHELRCDSLLQFQLHITQKLQSKRSAVQPNEPVIEVDSGSREGESEQCCLQREGCHCSFRALYIVGFMSDASAHPVNKIVCWGIQENPSPSKRQDLTKFLRHVFQDRELTIFGGLQPAKPQIRECVKFGDYDSVKTCSREHAEARNLELAMARTSKGG